MLKIIALCIAGLLVLALVLALSLEKLRERRDAARFQPPGRLVNVKGRQLHLLCKGAGEGPTVVIEQGLASPSILWWPVQDQVADFANVCTYDRPGSLWSAPGTAGRSLPERVADLHDLLAAAGLSGPYVLVGHSYGGFLMQLYARAYPDEVAGLVLVDSGPPSVLFRDDVQTYLGSSVKSVGGGIMAARLGAMRLGNPMFDGPIAGLTEFGQAALKAFTAWPRFYATLRDEMRSLVEAPAAVRTPPVPGSLGSKPLVVLAHGIPFPAQAGPMEAGWYEGQQQAATLSADSELIVATGSNHQIFLDQGELVVAAIRRVHAAARDRVPLAR